MGHSKDDEADISSFAVGTGGRPVDAARLITGKLVSEDCGGIEEPEWSEELEDGTFDSESGVDMGNGIGPRDVTSRVCNKSVN